MTFEERWLEAARLELAEKRKRYRDLLKKVRAQQKARRVKLPKKHQGNNIPGTELCRKTVEHMQSCIRYKHASGPPVPFAPKVKPLKPYVRKVRGWDALKAV